MSEGVKHHGVLMIVLLALLQLGCEILVRSCSARCWKAVGLWRQDLAGIS